MPHIRAKIIIRDLDSGAGRTGTTEFPDADELNFDFRKDMVVVIKNGARFEFSLDKWDTLMGNVNVQNNTVDITVGDF